MPKMPAFMKGSSKSNSGSMSGMGAKATPYKKGASAVMPPSNMGGMQTKGMVPKARKKG